MQSRAIRYDRYGPPDVLSLREVDRPSPLDDQVLIRTRAAALNPLDWHSMRGRPFVSRLGLGLVRPRRGHLGADLAGTVEAVGRDVTAFAPGDEVFGCTVAALAEHVAVSERGLAPMPRGASFEQAAATPVAGLTALQGLRDHGGIRAGQRVLVNGGAGGVGTFAVQIAKAYDAEVTAVCSARNMELVRSIGADEVVDYEADDFTRAGKRYDLVFDAVANRSLTALRRVLAPEGALVIAGAPPGDWIGPVVGMVKPRIAGRLTGRRMTWFLSSRSHTDLTTLKELIEGGRVTPVIGRSYRLDEVPEAIRHLETGHARGKIVITM